MINACFKSPYLIVSATLVWLFMAVTGFLSYAGSSLTYILFTLVFLFLLVDGLYRRLSFGYAFLVVFLWLGFWLKLVVHLWLNYSYLEPVGYFDGNAEAWDVVLTVSTVGALGVILTKMLFSKYAEKHFLANFEFSYYPPSWYPSVRSWLWGGTWFAIIFLPVINAAYGISQVGIVPSLILPWHLNALVIWCMGFGLAALCFTLVNWDHALGQGWVMGFSGVLAEAFLSSLSSISRAVYIFRTLPYLIVLYAKRLPKGQAGKRAKWIVLLVWLCLLAVSLSLVMVLRYSEGSPIDASSNKSQMVVKDSTSLGTFVGQISNRVAHLAVDRWIGLEGVMAVVSYPEKNFGLFAKVLQEKRDIGKVDFFTREISRAGVTDIDAIKFQYASIPGGIAFFYFTGSLWGVLAGMVCLTSVMLVSERAVYFLTRNPYMCSFWGMGVAQTLASFGTGVRQMATYYAICFVAMTLIWIIQTLPTSQRAGEE